MKGSEKAQRLGNPASAIGDEQPLLTALVWEAKRRGDTLAALAKQLGVTYERLAQWRRQESDIGKAKREVHQNASKYLGWPTVLVLAMAGTFSIKDFVWPCQDSLDLRVTKEMERLRQDPFLGAFVPAELAIAAPAVKLFVIFLAQQLTGNLGQQQNAYRWLRDMQLAAAGHVDAQLELDVLRKVADKAVGIF